MQNAEILRYFQPLCLSEISQARMKLKKLKIVNVQNHFANRNHKECKQCILHSVRRFADMISAVAEWKVQILRCECGEWVMKNGEGGVQITVFAAGKLGNVIAMRAFRMVFRMFSGLFDD